MASRRGKSRGSERFYFLGLQNHCGQQLQPWNEKTLAPWKESYDKPRQHIKKQRHHFVGKGPYSQSYGFASSHVQMWKLNHNEGWASKSCCCWAVVLDKTLESLLDCKEIKRVDAKGKITLSIHRQDWCWSWSWSSNIEATWCKEPTHWKISRCWERLKGEGEEGRRGWDG